VQPAELVQKVGRYLEGLNDRERRLLGLMGGVFLVLAVFLPIFFVGSAISDLETQNDELREVLDDIQRAGPTLDARRAERDAAMARYQREAPPLGSFLEEKAREQSLTLREVNDSPEQTVGNYTRRQVRVTLPGVQLLPVVKMLTRIENSGLPVTIDRIQIEHFREGEDSYNVQLGVSAYDRNSPEPDAAGEEDASSPSRGRRRPAPGASP